MLILFSIIIIYLLCLYLGSAGILYGSLKIYQVRGKTLKKVLLISSYLFFFYLFSLSIYHLSERYVSDSLSFAYFLDIVFLMIEIYLQSFTEKIFFYSS